MVHSFAFSLYLSISSLYKWAMSGSSGSSGLGSVNKEQIDSRILVTVRAGDHAVFKISRHIPPCLLILG